MGMRGPLVGYSDGEEDEAYEDPEAADDGEASTVAGEAGTTSPPSFS